MPIEILLKIEKKVTKRVKDIFGLSRHDLLILLCCRSMEESLYSLVNNHGLDRGLTVKRLKILEVSGIIRKESTGRKKLIVLSKKAQEAIRFVEDIKI